MLRGNLSIFVDNELVLSESNQILSHAVVNLLRALVYTTTDDEFKAFTVKVSDGGVNDDGSLKVVDKSETTLYNDGNAVEISNIELSLSGEELNHLMVGFLVTNNEVISMDISEALLLVDGLPLAKKTFEPVIKSSVNTIHFIWEIEAVII